MLSFLKNDSEKFLTLDVDADRTTGVWFRVDADRNIVVEKFDGAIDLAAFLSAPLRRAAQASWEGKYLFDSRRRVSAAVDATRATTMPIPLSWRRDSMRTMYPLTIDEIDDHIGRVLPKISSECRVEAARRFGIDAIDVVLVGAMADDIAVDGRRALRGEGVVGHAVSLMLTLTFTTREISDRFNPFFNSPEPFFFAELPQAMLSVVSLVRSLPCGMVSAPEHGTGGSLFVLQYAKEKYPVLYRENFLWPFSEVLDSIVDRFSVSRAAALHMYHTYIVGNVSPAVGRTFDEIIAGARVGFEKSLRHAKVRGSIFIDAPYLAPYVMPHKEGRATLEAFPLAQLFAKFDLTLHAGSLASEPRALSRHAALFLAMYFDRGRSAVNERLRRRVHWLAR